MKSLEAVSALKALSQETRLEIIRYLIHCGAKGAAAGEIGQQVEATASRLSFHLSALEHAGLIASERQSRHIIYRADFERLGRLIAFLLNDCCDNHPDITACCFPNQDNQDCC